MFIEDVLRKSVFLDHSSFHSIAMSFTLQVYSNDPMLQQINLPPMAPQPVGGHCFVFENKTNIWLLLQKKVSALTTI